MSKAREELVGEGIYNDQSSVVYDFTKILFFF